MNCKLCVFSQSTYNSKKLWCNRYNALVKEVKKLCNEEEKQIKSK